MSHLMLGWFSMGRREYVLCATSSYYIYGGDNILHFALVGAVWLLQLALHAWLAQIEGMQ